MYLCRGLHRDNGDSKATIRHKVFVVTPEKDLQCGTGHWLAEYKHRPSVCVFVSHRFAHTGNVHTLTGDLPTGIGHWLAALKHDPMLGEVTRRFGISYVQARACVFVCLQRMLLVKNE